MRMVVLLIEKGMLGVIDLGVGKRRFILVVLNCGWNIRLYSFSGLLEM